MSERFAVTNGDAVLQLLEAFGLEPKRVRKLVLIFEPHSLVIADVEIFQAEDGLLKAAGIIKRRFKLVPIE